MHFCMSLSVMHSLGWEMEERGNGSKWVMRWKNSFFIHMHAIDVIIRDKVE
jgi:hypothetical protein